MCDLQYNAHCLYSNSKLDRVGFFYSNIYFATFDIKHGTPMTQSTELEASDTNCVSRKCGSTPNSLKSLFLQDKPWVLKRRRRNYCIFLERGLIQWKYLVFLATPVQVLCKRPKELLLHHFNPVNLITAERTKFGTFVRAENNSVQRLIFELKT